MKRIKLTESTISETDIKNAIDTYNSMDQSEKESWITCIQKCIEEMGYGKISKADIITGGFGIGLVVVGVKLNIPVLCAMGAVAIGAVAHFDKDVWEKIIQCARNKRKGITTTDNTIDRLSTNNTTGIPTPEKTIQETKMKKTIRLTESELVKLVQKIIKEDEMMGVSSKETNGKKNCKVSLRNLLSNEKPYNFDYYKNGQYIFTVMEGKGWEQSPGGLAPIRQFNNMDKVFFINEGNQVTIDIRENKGSRGDSFSISCSNGVANLSGKPQTYGP